jgi:predicted component of type VI protein secretion system
LLLSGQRITQRIQLLLKLCGLRRQLAALSGELLQRSLLLGALLRGGIAGLSPLGLGR